MDRHELGARWALSLGVAWMAVSVAAFLGLFWLGSHAFLGGVVVVLAFFVFLAGMTVGTVQAMVATRASRRDGSAARLQAAATGLGVFMFLFSGLMVLSLGLWWLAAVPLAVVVLQAILQTKAPWTTP